MEQMPSSAEPPDISKLRDITGIEKRPTTDSGWWWTAWWWLALPILPGLLLVGWKLYFRSRGDKPALPPDRWALAELERIDRLDLPAAGAFERYHTLLSDAIRHYFELRFQLPASKQTTPEFLKTVAASGHLAPDQQSLLASFLERCDLAKFARVPFSPPECQVAAAMARDLVQQTTPSPSLKC
jgi:hypothetical protein